MNGLKPLLFFGLVLIIALGVFCYGRWLALDGAHHLNRYEVPRGILILLPGALILPGILCVLVNRFVPSERQRLQENLKRIGP